ncbi:Cupin domain-containing protein [Fervidobacterium changbaicum]|uniref:Cupin domain-containing protein n=2 Tax=Fervidobacterium TaxID=2422 RepID=A0AAI8CLF4_FERIS|nr:MULTISPECIES: cupin domain-containing protein [Fervidobacterium]AMW33103.1 cupin domain-containing protein [Fervidobacterium islandicum]QAV33145.1 cupin domain-containing protein [Fervidobacterium changbaicum]SDH11551.1 Cupin domain-containing protein [Fervidobacterium changbaicum]
MVYRVSDTPNLMQGPIDARRFYESKKAIVAQITLQPGGKLEKHSSKEFALLFVIFGKVRVEVGDHSYELEQDSLIEFPQNILHSVENVGDGVAKVLVVKIK